MERWRLFCSKGGRASVATYLFVVLAATCSPSTDPDPAASGVFVLTMYESPAFPRQALPVPIDPLFTREGQPTGCWRTLSNGALELSTIEPGSFSYYVVYRNSCSDGVLSAGGLAGHFVQKGTALTFTPVGSNNTFSGQLVADTVVVELFEAQLFYFVKGGGPE
jgi:hypothetical protein